jgi:serine phosphatase RsbU (regulator of sigma subunit)
VLIRIPSGRRSRFLLLMLSFVLSAFVSGNTGLNGDSLKNVLSNHEKAKDSVGIIKDYCKLSRWASKEGHDAAALEYLYKALKTAEKLKDKRAQADCCYRLAVLYDRQEDTKKAIVYALRSSDLARETGDSTCLASASHRMGLAYSGARNYPEAEKWLNYALEIRTRLKQKGGIAACLNGLGVAYMDQKKYALATSNIFKAYGLWKEVHDREGIAIASGNLGSLYLGAEDYENAIRYARQSYDTARAIGSFIFMEPAAKVLADAYLKLKNYEQAFAFYRIYSQVKDTLFNEDNTRKFAQAQADYQTQKVVHQLQLLEKDKKQQSLVRNLLLVGIAVVLLLVFGIYSRYRLKQQANRQLQLANQKIQLSHNEIASQKKELTDSINYARRIQQAILPGKQELLKDLPDSFIYYRPKDIVSGDFYWYSRIGHLSILAVADCTGHGVPGAFMSMIGNDLINDIVNDKKNLSPSSILNELDVRLRQALSKSSGSSEINDGMDIVLCAIDVEKKHVCYSGAHRPLIHVQGKTLKEYKADKFAIGGYEIPGKKFRQFDLTASNGDALYLFTDGYTDQFGGGQGKKFKYKRFLQLLLGIAGKDMIEQENIIAETFTSWKGALEQLDDVLVIGIRL